MTPPRKTPAAAAIPLTAPHAPSAVLRSLPSRKLIVSSESAAGAISAAPAPEQVAQAASEQEEIPVGEDVAAYHPLQVLLREAQGVLDGGHDRGRRCTCRARRQLTPWLSASVP